MSVWETEAASARIWKGFRNVRMNIWQIILVPMDATVMLKRWNLVRAATVF